MKIKNIATITTALTNKKWKNITIKKIPKTPKKLNSNNNTDRCTKLVVPSMGSSTQVGSSVKEDCPVKVSSPTVLYDYLVELLF